METYRKSRQYDIGADDMWRRVGDFHSADKWHPMIDASEPLDGGGARRLTLTDGTEMVERLVERGDRLLRYQIEESPLPFTSYVATLRVTETGPGACVVDWEGEGEPAGVSGDEAREMVEGILTAGLDALA